MSEILAGRQGAGQTRADLFYKPNMQLVNQALAARQQRYNVNYAELEQFNAKMDEVNALEADKERWFNLKDTYDKKIDSTLKANRGDLSKSGALLKGLKSEIGDLFGIHGEANAIDSNYMSAMKNRQELKKRREKGDITEGQYRGWDVAISEYKGIGDDSRNWNTWQSVNAVDAVDPDDFLRKHIKIYESDIINSGYKKIIQGNGKIFYQNEAKDIIKYDDVYNGATKALKSKMEETGQLNADYKWRMFSTGEKPSVSEYVNQYSTSSTELKQHAAALSTNDEKALRAALSNYDEDLAGQIEKVPIKDLYTLRDKLLKGINEGVTTLDGRITDLNDLNEDGVKNYHYNQYATNTVSELVKPYAEARSRQKIKLDLKIVDDVIFKHKLDIEKEQLRYKHERMLVDYKFKTENPRLDVRKKGEALTFERPGGLTVEEATSEIAKNNTTITQSQDGILREMYNTKYGSNNPKAPSYGSFKKDFYANSGFTLDDFSNAKAETVNGQTYISVLGSDGTTKRILAEGMSASAINRELDVIKTTERKNSLINQRRTNADNTALHNLRNQGLITDVDIDMYKNLGKLNPDQSQKVKEAYAVYSENFSKNLGGGIKSAFNNIAGMVVPGYFDASETSYQTTGEAFREKLTEEEFTDMVTRQYDNSYSLGWGDTAKRNDHLGVIYDYAPQLYQELENTVIKPRKDFEGKMSLINRHSEEIYGDATEHITVAPDLYNIDIILGDVSAEELAYTKKAWDQYVKGDQAKADLASTEVMVAGKEGFTTMAEMLKENNASDYTIGNSFWTASPIVNDGVTSVFNILMETEVDGKKQLISKEIHVPTSELSADFIENYAAKNQVIASKDYYDAVKSSLSEYEVPLGNLSGANYTGTIFLGGDHNQSPKERRSSSYGMISIDNYDSKTYNGLVNKNDINKKLPYEQYERLRVDLENFAEFELQAKNRFTHLSDAQIKGIYSLSNNTNLSANEIVTWAEQKGNIDPIVTRALLNITPTGKKRALASTLDGGSDSYSLSYSTSKTTK